MFSVVQVNAREPGSDLDWGTTECVVQVEDGRKAAASRRTPNERRPDRVGAPLSKIKMKVDES